MDAPEKGSRNSDVHPVRVHIGDVNARRNAQPPEKRRVVILREDNETRQGNILFVQPLLFSNIVNAVSVDTRWSPLHTSSATIAAIVVPTVLGSVRQSPIPQRLGAKVET